MEVVHERFTNDAHRKEHYAIHVGYPPKEFASRDFPTEEEYEAAADALANSHVDYNKVVGFTSKRLDRITFCKYDRNKEAFVAYFRKGDEPMIVTFFKAPMWRYNALKDRDYTDELPAEEL